MQDSLLIVILAILSMMGALGIDTYLPSFPSIASTFAVSPVVVQQTLSVFVLCMAAMMLFYGTLSDSFGRRPVILVSLVLYVIASVGAALGWAQDGSLLVWNRSTGVVEQRAGEAVTLTPARLDGYVVATLRARMPLTCCSSGCPSSCRATAPCCAGIPARMPTPACNGSSRRSCGPRCGEPAWHWQIR